MHPSRRINLRSAVSQAAPHIAQAMSFSELVAAYCAVQFDGADLRMRKWVEAFGNEDAWTLTTHQIAIAAEAMVEHGYKPSTVNRDTSTIGTIYRWAIARRLAPAGFRSPSLGVPRYEEAIRVVEIKPAEVAALLDGAKAFADRRFAAFVRLLVETGARKSEILERRGADLDLDARTITCPKTKTGRPRVLFFSQETADLIRRVWPRLQEDTLLFEGERSRGQPAAYRRQWVALTASIGREGLHMHDMRHHRAAEMLKRGQTIAIAAQVLGHSSLILQRRYGHLETAALRTAAEASWNG